VAKFQILLRRELEKGKVDKRVQGHDRDVVDPPPLQAARRILIKESRNPGLAIDHVVVRDRESLVVEDEPRPLTRWSLDRDHRLAEPPDQILDRGRFQVGRLVEASGVDLEASARSDWPMPSRRYPRAAQDLILGDLDDVEPEVNEEEIRLLGDDLADDLVPVLELYDLGARQAGRGTRDEPDQSRGRRPAQPIAWSVNPSGIR